MTSGLGKGLDNALADIEKYSTEQEEHPEPRGEIFDWMSEQYQLMCREYLLALGWKNPKNMECPLQTESERKYWERLHVVRGYEPYEGRYFDYEWKPGEEWKGGQWRPIITIPDPPEEFQAWWLKERGESWSSHEIEIEEEYQSRLAEFEARITASDSARRVRKNG